MVIAGEKTNSTPSADILVVNDCDLIEDDAGTEPQLPDLAGCGGKSAFSDLLTKRIDIITYSHNELNSFYSNLGKLPKSRVKKANGLKPNVPFVLRMSVLSLLPIIESIPNNSNVKESVLGTLVEMLRSLPVLGLANEPVDCLNMFQVIYFPFSVHLID